MWTSSHCLPPFPQPVNSDSDTGSISLHLSYRLSIQHLECSADQSQTPGLLIARSYPAPWNLHPWLQLSSRCFFLLGRGASFMRRLFSTLTSELLTSVIYLPSPKVHLPCDYTHTHTHSPVRASTHRHTRGLVSCLSFILS